MNAKRFDSREGGVRQALAARLPLPCSRCGQDIERGEPWDVDHLTPQAEGGGDEVANLWPAHRACNRSHGGKLGRKRQTDDNRGKRDGFFISSNRLPGAFHRKDTPRSPKLPDTVAVRLDPTEVYR